MKNETIIITQIISNLSSFGLDDFYCVIKTDGTITIKRESDNKVFTEQIDFKNLCKWYENSFWYIAGYNLT